jgi:hypothetical protein
MPLPQQLAVEVDALRAGGKTVEVIEEFPRFYVIFHAFQLPGGLYLPDTTDLMVMADYLYPQSRLDMYWTDPTVRKLDGSLPQNADQFEPHLNRPWQRWSWHYPTWNPATHNVSTHLEVFYDRVRRGC